MSEASDKPHNMRVERARHILAEALRRFGRTIRKNACRSDETKCRARADGPAFGKSDEIGGSSVGIARCSATRLDGLCDRRPTNG